MAYVTLSEVNNISIPYLGAVPQPFCVGRQIYIHGFLQQNQTFAVNLQCGTQKVPQLDVALHFNPRPSEDCVVRNSHEGGQWKKEERWGSFPFQTGQNFELVFQVENEHFKILVNGRHFQNFQHRLSLHRVTHIGITGAVTVYTVRHTNPAKNPYPVIPGARSNPSIKLPYLEDIPPPIRDGKKIIIRGHMPQNSGTFAINLQCGRQDPPNVDVALHFNPRFTENCVVRNSHEGGQWKTEEKWGGFPFQTGQTFELVFLIEHQHYKITVNGNLFQTFQHRIPIHRVTTLGIKGNVTVNSIRFEDLSSQVTPGLFAAMDEKFGMISISQMQPVYSSSSPRFQEAHHYTTGGIGYPQPMYHPKGPPVMPSPCYQYDLPPPYEVSSPGLQRTPHYTPGGASYSQPIYRPTVPFISGIPGGLQPGKMMYVDGQPLSTCNRFSLNLQSDATETANIAFHFDVRISFNRDNNVIVRNSRFSGSWGAEERDAPYFPFMRSVPFQLMILFEVNHVKVAVNSQHFLEFRYRLNYGDHMSNYSIIKIQGDVELSQIRFQ